jgi:hypothetical protein
MRKSERIRRVSSDARHTTLRGGVCVVDNSTVDHSGHTGLVVLPLSRNEPGHRKITGLVITGCSIEYNTLHNCIVLGEHL